MKYIQILVLVLVSHLLVAQVPSAFSYQGLLVEADGNGLSDKEVEFIITLSSEDDGGIIYFQESQNIQTDQNGVFNFNIGEGILIGGNMGEVEWLSSIPYIGIDYDLNDGQGTQSLGYNQFNSVPFCFYSKYVVCQQGPKGFPGENGPHGVDGAPGPTGQTSVTGATGATGPNGDPLTSLLDTPPIDPKNGTVYLDDGTNTLDGLPRLKYFDVDTWIEL